MAEFTGERVVPGQVQPDLWNEHLARYCFAARLARQKRVLDIACGSGYGSAELAAVAGAVTGIDISSEAIAYAREHYTLPNLTFECSPADAIPRTDQSYDLIVAFEVIEHLENASALLAEARRLLSPGGQFIVSTPNKLYYQETRALSGPNPFHVHEFEFEEFRGLLAGFFPDVSLFLQNHIGSIVFQPAEMVGSTEVRMAERRAIPTEAHFFVAVCALKPQTGSPTFVYLPSTSNVLREREHHIQLLEHELDAKTKWLEKALADHQQLVREHEAQTEELKERNLWAEDLNVQLRAAAQRIVQLQDESAADQKAYEAKVADLHQDIASKTKWALDIEERLTAELTAKLKELAECVEILHQTEAQLEERTKWALALKTQMDHLEANLNAVSASRWHRFGRSLGLGPELTNS
ncbi:MAG: Ubiquinone biosynthesis O-methyltransferase [Bryobacteraceae bacterium]|nr:Ubiquinone biosynthesis O-methyltransferase [Bryobacteraceae bacterium]